MHALLPNEKVSRFRISELERIFFDTFAPTFAEAKQNGFRRIELAADKAGPTTLHRMPGDIAGMVLWK